MTQAKSTFITLENTVKLVVLSSFFVAIINFLMEIKQDIALIKQGNKYEIKDLQYQITELKDCCNGHRNERRIVFNHSPATVPNEVEFKTEE